MLYKAFIEKYFLIDTPETGQLVPFKLRKVQDKYYQQLCDDYDIENNGINVPVREIILKARREGFSSLILALFAADDLMQDNPTESLAISYRDDATETFRKRYRLYLTSFYAREEGYTIEQIQQNPAILDEMAKKYFSVDANDIELKHNKAHFYCGTASARTGGRGGVLQKLLYSEEAHYPDTEKMTAKEIVDGTLRQVDISSGFVFRETTANGYGNYYQLTWALAVEGKSRFKPRFFGWREMYTEEEFRIISSEFTDKTILKQEYPETPEEAFIASGTGYFDNERIYELLKLAPEIRMQGTITLRCNHQVPCRSLVVCDFRDTVYTEMTNGPLKIWQLPKPSKSYIMGGDVAEGVNADRSTLRVIDNETGALVAKFSSANIPPHEYAIIAYALGQYYNYAYTGIESNKDGLWVNHNLFEMGYPNLYYREVMDDITHTVGRKVGFKTGPDTRPVILSELLHEMATLPAECFPDRDFLGECLTFVRDKVGKPGAMNGCHDDEIFAEAIARKIRGNAPASHPQPKGVEQTSAAYVQQRLERIKNKNNKNNPFAWRK